MEKIAIIIEGGLVQGVITTDKALIDREIIVIDYDIDGVDESEIVAIRSIGLDKNDLPEVYPATVHTAFIEPAGIDLGAIQTD